MVKSLSVAEKRVQLGQRGAPWPVCVCHGEPKIWKAGKRSGGGSWNCRVKQRDRIRRYRATQKGQVATALSNRMQAAKAAAAGLCTSCRFRPAETLGATCARCRRYKAEVDWLGYSKIPLAKGSDG